MAAKKAKHVFIKDLRDYALTFGIIVSGVNCELNNEDKNTLYKSFIFTHEDCKRSDELKYNGFRNRIFKCKYCPQDKDTKYFDINAYTVRHRRNGKTEEQINEEIKLEIDNKIKQKNGELVNIRGGGAGSKFSYEQVLNVCNKLGFELLDKVYINRDTKLKIKHMTYGYTEDITFNAILKRFYNKEDIKESKEDIKQDLNDGAPVIKRNRTKEQIIAEIKNLGYTFGEDYTGSKVKMLLIHDCGFEDEFSWHDLQRRYNNDPNNYCEGCSNFVSRKKKFKLDAVLDNLKEVENKLNLTCINKDMIDKPIFDAKFQCNKCGVIKQVKFYKKMIRGCQSCSSFKGRGELFCKNFLQNIFNKPFITVRPKFLTYINKDPLELDCFNQELKLALEFQGKQHLKYDPFFHCRDFKKFEEQQQRDLFKREKCREYGINLIEVTYLDEKIGENHMKKKILDELKLLGYDIDEKKKDEKVNIEGGKPQCVNLDNKISEKLEKFNYRFLFETKETHTAKSLTIVLCNYGHHYSTTYDNLGNKNGGCPYCANKKFTEIYLNHNFIIRGWTLNVKELTYKNTSQKSYIIYECECCKLEQKNYMSEFRQILKDGKYPCIKGCVTQPPVQITEKLYKIMLEYLSSIR